MVKIRHFFSIIFILFIGISLSWPIVSFADGLSSTIFPSTSPLSKKYEEAFHHDESNLTNAGYDFNDLNILYVAFDQRDEAWTTADMILKGMQTGKINSKNLTNYLADEAKIAFSSPSAVSWVINKVKSFGDKAILSTNYTKGIPPDYMIIKKEKGKTKVNIVVVKKINSEKQIITIALSANYPYKKWLLEGIYFTTLLKFPNSLPLPNSGEKLYFNQFNEPDV